MTEPCKRVLVVEDDQDVRDGLVWALEFAGFLVESAPNGAEGLRLLIKHEDIGLVLLDLMMPVMDGWQFLDALREWRGARVAPQIVIMSALDDRSRPANAAAGRMNKPVDLEQLLAVVEKYCSRPPRAEHQFASRQH